MPIVPFPQQLHAQLTMQIELEPVRQVLLTMALLSTEHALAEQETWLRDIAVQLTEAEQQFNQLLFHQLSELIWLRLDEPSFPKYLAALETVNMERIVKRLRQTLVPETSDTDPQTVNLASLLDDVPTLQRLVIDHLRLLWHAHFAQAWEQKQSMMVYMANELNGREWPLSSANALIGAFLRQPVPEWLAGQLGTVERIIFVPSPYLHLQAAKLPQIDMEPTTIWIFLWADFWVWPMRTEPIQRTEVLRSITALDDETRLQILEMVAAAESLRAQEIIAQLDVSQSTVSRHLKQLVATGFLSEERAGDTNKIYHLHHKRIGEVTHSLTQLLSQENAQLVLSDMRLQQPAELRPFLDRDGLVTSWPAKRKGQEAVLAYFITKFEMGTEYSEAEVNEILTAWHTYDDPAYMRRWLIDVKLLQRTPDGSRYWRTE